MIRELKVPKNNITYFSKYKIFVSLIAESRSVAFITSPNSYVEKSHE